MHTLTGWSCDLQTCLFPWQHMSRWGCGHMGVASRESYMCSENVFVIWRFQCIHWLDGMWSLDLPVSMTIHMLRWGCGHMGVASRKSYMCSENVFVYSSAYTDWIVMWSSDLPVPMATHMFRWGCDHMGVASCESYICSENVFVIWHCTDWMVMYATFGRYVCIMIWTQLPTQNVKIGVLLVGRKPKCDSGTAFC